MTGKTTLADSVRRVLVTRSRDDLVLSSSKVGVPETATFESWFKLKFGATCGDAMQRTSEEQIVYFVVEEVRISTESNIRFMLFVSYVSTPTYLVTSNAKFPRVRCLGLNL